MIDFKKLTYDEFEVLVGLLLKRAGHQIAHGPGSPGTRGPDYQTVSPDGHSVIVEVKHFTRGIGKSRPLIVLGCLLRRWSDSFGAEVRRRAVSQQNGRCSGYLRTIDKVMQVAINVVNLRGAYAELHVG